MRGSLRTTATAAVLALGLIGTAQAENFNIFSASKAQQAAQNGTVEQVRRGGGVGGVRMAGGRVGGFRGGRVGYGGFRGYGYRGYGYRRPFPGVAVGLGAAAVAAGTGYGYYNYNCNPYYEYCGYRRGYYAPRVYGPRRGYYYR
jgi:hypothetical protein